MRYYINGFKKYAKTEGRATRKEFWMFTLFHCIFSFMFALIDEIFLLYPETVPLDYGYSTIIYFFVSACPCICLQVRRLHDVNKSGFWWLINYIPIVCLYLFYLNVTKGTPGANKYGEPSEFDKNYYGKSPQQTPQMILEKELTVIKQVCHVCGSELDEYKRFCHKCGAEVVKITEPESNIKKFRTIIFDAKTGDFRTEMRNVDTIKFPPSKYAADDTYYAIEKMRDDKKVRVYCTKDSWDKQIDAESNKTDN